MKTASIAALVCLFSNLLAVAQTHRSDVKSHPVNSFQVQQVNMIDALLRLGQEQHVPIGIEYIEKAAFHRQITLHSQNTTLGGVLEALTHPDGYFWLIQGETIIVTHKGAPQGSKNLLNVRIPSFVIPREVTLHAAGFQLLMHLNSVLHPNSGIIADYPGGNPQFRVGPFTMKNATVRQILNRIVSEHKNGVWVVQQAPWNMDKNPDYGLWKIFEYDNKGGQYSDLLQVWGLGLHDPR